MFPHFIRTSLGQINAITGIITTVAGNYSANRFSYFSADGGPAGTSALHATVIGGKYSGDGGPAISAGLYRPVAVAVDAKGNVFIADSSNNAIRMVRRSLS